MDTFVPSQPEPPIPPNQVTVISPSSDRSTGLVIFGILLIVIGCFAALFVPFILVTALIARKSMGAGLPFGNVFMSVTTYGGLAIVLIVLGIGSIRARRWAHDLTLIGGWLWLITGTLLTIFMTVVMPSSFAAGFKAAAQRNPQASLPPGALAVVLTLVIVFFSVFLIAVPIALVLFYRRDDVRETCRRRDTAVGWTERCPLPVLAVCLLFIIGAAYYLLTALALPLYPFFGTYLTGLPARALLAFAAGLDILLAILLYRLKPLGWWLAASAILLRIVSLAITVQRGDLLEAYRRVGWSQQQIQALTASPSLRLGLWSGVALSGIFLLYLLWIKRSFVAREAMPPSLDAPVV
jgi:hypothetical protein